MAPHSNTLAWKIPWMEEPGRLQSMGSLRVGHDWATSLSFSLSCIGEGNGNPLRCSCLENPRDCGAWLAAVYGVARSRTRLKRLSSSSSNLVLLLKDFRSPNTNSCTVYSNTRFFSPNNNGQWTDGSPTSLQQWTLSWPPALLRTPTPATMDHILWYSEGTS